MTRRFLHPWGLLVLFSLFFGLQAQADYVELDGLWYATQSDGTATIKCPVVDYVYGDVVLPETIEHRGKTYRVTRMDETVFQECLTITGITFNEGLESIGDEAFIDCTNLKTVNFCSTLTAIGVGVFEHTPWLESQPDGMIYAGQVAMLYKGLIPEGTHFVLDESIRHVGTSAFYAQRGMASMTLPEGLLTIGSGAFCSCKGMTAITLPSTLETMGNDCFRDCWKLASVRIPDQITEIGSYAFINCESLTEVTLPESLTRIQFQAFEGCKSLTAIELPAGLTQIGRRAFDKCPALRQITALSTVPPVCASENTFMQEHYDEAELTVPAGSLAAYQEAKGWKNFKHISEAAVSAVHDVTASVPVYRLQGTVLHLSAAAAAQGLTVYAPDGTTLYTGHAEAVTLPAGQVCLLRIGHRTYKVLVP